ncbi:MAG: hypothetical protein LBW77_00800, partial [Verrucomicrobiota bacterium]|nr:hypothetical protein [Verrucomicrobiota bacterium]
MLQVCEIIERCAENVCVSRPFKVRADDGQFYYLKGCGTGWTRKELCYELLSARLAERFGLPIAPFGLLGVPTSLLEFCTIPDIRQGVLTAGPAFGSQLVEDTVSLLPVMIQHVPEEVRQKILIFDWWIQNADRILGDLGGNVNLLWTPARGQVIVIDHNNAFASDFDETVFFENHVFRDERNKMTPVFVSNQQNALSDLFTHFDELICDFPDEWMIEYDSPGDFAPKS